MGVWNWLKDPDHRGKLFASLVGAVPLLALLWQVVVYFFPAKPADDRAKPATAITASGGGIAIDGNVMNSTVTAGSQALPGAGPGKGPAQQ